eukprot:TRINITY_DN15862_c2_g1_i1.p1 TRINITY_DN15862_c2_g1~~TRINITY_DN15862_c2_g1_i1.p1  ORF type:complete len:164 (-),score=26.14 TRINITY_DN15862_c2_g1_i1:69-536(-)
MSKISDKMGGVPREVRQRLEEIRKTPITLQETCKNGDLKAIEAYLAETEHCPRMRDLDAKDQRGVSCLGYAVGANRISIAKRLVEAGADPSTVDNAGNSSLHYASGYGRQEMLEYLLTLGINVNQRNKRGETALDVAEKNKQTKSVDMLKRHSAS